MHKSHIMHRQYVLCLINANNIYSTIGVNTIDIWEVCSLDCACCLDIRMLLGGVEIRDGVHYQVKSVGVGLRGEGSNGPLVKSKERSFKVPVSSAMTLLM